MGGRCREAEAGHDGLAFEVLRDACVTCHILVKEITSGFTPVTIMPM